MDMAPVFILCTPRSGSTLLQRLLNTHPLLHCPAESNVAAVANTYFDAVRGILGPEMASADTTVSEIRRFLEKPVDAALRAHGKTLWCDKSLTHYELVETLHALWPQARFVCLFRHVADFVASALDASPWGLRGYGFDVNSHDANTLEQLCRRWIDTNEAILDWSRQQPALCHQLYYEDLVTQPHRTLAALASFLCLSPFPDPAEHLAQSRAELGQPGDHKTHFDPEIHAQSLGKGYRIPVADVHRAVLHRMNALLKSLDYLPISPSWGSRPDMALRSESPPIDEVGAAAGTVAENAITQEGGRYGTPVAIYDGTRLAAWITMDLSNGHVQRMSCLPAGPTGTFFVTDLPTLRGISAGELHVAAAFRHRHIRMYGDGSEAADPHKSQAIAHAVGTAIASEAERILRLVATRNLENDCETTYSDAAPTSEPIPTLR